MAVLLIGFRLALPGIAKRNINKQINNLEGYHGGVSDVRLALIAGQFWLSDIIIYEETAIDTSIPMVNLPSLWFAIEWRSLFKGHIVASIEMDSLMVNLVKAEADKEDEVMENRVSFVEEIQEFNPIQINTIIINNANIRYRDPTANPEINVGLSSFYLQAENLGNVVDQNDPLPARYELHSEFMESGNIFSEGRLNLLREVPDFDIDFKIEEVDMTVFNSLLSHHADLNLQKGLLFYYMEAVAADGQIEGYVKPLMEGVEIAKEEEGGVVKKIYEGVVQGAVNLLENRQEEQVGARVEISGSLKDTEVSIFQAILSLLRNAFIDAYDRELDRIIGSSRSRAASK